MKLWILEIQRYKTPAQQKYEQFFVCFYGKNVSNKNLIKLNFICLQHIYASKMVHSKSVYNNRIDSHPSQSFIDKQINISTAMMVSGVAIIIYIVLSTLREFVQIYQQKCQYVFEPNNFISWMLYVSAAIMVSPIFNGGWISDTHFSATSITVFLSWFNLLLFLQRFDQVCCIPICAIHLWVSIYSNFKWMFFSFIGWHLCGYVFGDFTNIDQSTFGIFDFNNCIWFGILHCFVKIKGNRVNISNLYRK